MTHPFHESKTRIRFLALALALGSLEWLLRENEKGWTPFCFDAPYVPLNCVSLGLAGILECSEHSSFLKDLKTQTAEVHSFCSLSGSCR